MEEVVVALRFVTPCLGGVRSEALDTFLRNSEGQVIFLPSWWAAMFRQAAQMANLAQVQAGKILVQPAIEGVVGTYRRYYRPREYKDHEAFLAGTTIKVKMILPAGLTREELYRLLEMGGQYCGLSPYGHGIGFGRFSLVQLPPRTGA
jgi:hypothetical protein